MLTYFVEAYVSTWQYDMYGPITKKAQKHPTIAAVACIPAAFAEITLETLKSPLQIIEGLALVIINLLGMLFHKECTFKHLLLNLDKTFTFTIHTPVAFALAPFKFIYQAVCNFKNPKYAKCYNEAVSSMRSQDLTYTNTRPLAAEMIL